MKHKPLLVVVVVGTVLAFASAMADDIATITINDAGPDKTIPTDKPFYLAGIANGSKLVDAMIVRTGHPDLFHGDPDSCATVASKLKELKNASLDQQTTGATTADVLWKDGDHDWDVKVLTWKAIDSAGSGAGSGSGSGANDTFKVFVEHDDFFGPGHRYCIYIYKNVTTQQTSYDAADAVLKVVDDTAKSCKSTDTCTIDHAAIAEKLKAVKDDNVRKAASAAAESSLSFAFSMYQAADRISVWLNNWTGQALTSIQLHASEGGPLASATIGLLGYYDKLIPKLSTSRSAIEGYVTRDGRVETDHVGFIGNDVVRAIGVAPVGKTPTPTTIDVKTSELGIPDATGTLRDLLQLAQGQLPYDTTYLSAADYWKKLKPILSKTGTALSDDDTKVMTMARSSLERVRATVAVIHQAHQKPAVSGKNPFDAASKAAIQWDLGAWMLTFEEPLGKGGWDSYNNVAQRPLDALVTAIDQFTTAQPQWLAARPVVRTATTTVVQVSQPIPMSIEFTQDTWFFSYVSPTVGYAIASPVRSGEHETFATYYLGFDVHVVPNPEHKFGGLGTFAIELGAAPGLGSYGPDNRFRGWKNIAPLFGGIGVHIIPYTTISVGAWLADRRTSTVTQESYDSIWGGYVGFSVDANLPELVRSSVGKSSTTTTSSSAGSTPSTP